MRLAAVSAAMLACILIPFFLWGEQIEHWAGGYVRSGAGWWPVACVITALLAADILLPVPSSILSTASGALLGFVPGVAATWLGMTAGCGIGYWLGSRTNGAKLLGPVELDRVRRARERFGDWMLIVFRAVPVLAEASVFFAGLTAMPRTRFLALCSASNLGIAIVYSAAGAFFAGSDSFLWAFGAALGLPAVALLAVRYASIFRTTVPPTSVNRKSRPM